jgi:hypothetical protein
VNSAESSTAQQASVSEELLSDLEPEWDVLFSFIRDRQATLSATIAQMAPDRMSAVVTTRSLALLAQDDSPRAHSSRSGPSSGDEVPRTRLSAGTLPELLPGDRRMTDEVRMSLLSFC